MKLEALRSFGLKGVVVQLGEGVEASPTDARQLINSGQAKEAVVCEVQSEPSPPKPKTPRKPKKPTPTSDE